MTEPLSLTDLPSSAAVMSALVSWKASFVYGYLAWALFVHFRGRERHKFHRQLTDHSTIIAPYNAIMYGFSAVPNRPFVDVARFPELKPLQDNWQMIRDEALQLFEDGHIRAAAKYNDLGFNSFFRRGWKRFYLKWYDAPLPSAHGAVPEDRRAGAVDPHDQRRDVRDAARRRRARPASRSVRRLAALSPRGS